MQELPFLTHLAVLQLSAFAAAVLGDDFIRQHPCLFPAITVEQVSEEEEQLRQDFLACQREGEVIRWAQLVRTLGLNRTAQHTLRLALAITEQPELMEVCQALCGAPGATVGLAARLEEFCTHQPPSLSQLEEAFETLEYIMLPDEPTLLFDRRVFTAGERLYLHLLGSDTPDRTLRGYVERSDRTTPLPPLFVHQTQKTRVEEMLQSPQPTLLQIAGEPGSGRRFLLRHAAASVGLELLFVDYGMMSRLDSTAFQQHMWRVRRELLLNELVVCFHGVDSSTPDTPAEFIHRCITPLSRLSLPVCVCTDERTGLIPLLERRVELIPLPPLNRGERAALWQGFWGASGSARTLDLSSAANKYRLSAAQIKKAVSRLALLSPGSLTPVTGQELSQACTQVLPAASSGSLQYIPHHFSLEDIKLHDHQKQVLCSICAHVTHRARVYDQWDMESRYAYGKTVAALFTGPPGTGKTMAAHVVANMLSLPLYTVDLSQVVDKYIGETEKKLEEIFNHAQKSNSILFFDEADAIFGKRSEVNEAKDRYANTEVSYILQRIEKYDGIVILASNFKQNIDEAFMRRIRYVIDFTFPDEELRREIWRSCFPEKAPLEEVDFHYLAHQFRLVGGEIKNIALNAAFLAAQEDSSIGMGQILRCIRQERMKLGGTMLPEDFGEYAYLLT